jgi:hypothetical protein
VSPDHVERIRAAIAACDQRAFTMTLAGLLAHYRADELSAEAVRLLDAAEHDVQQYWRGTCNCDGHLN